MRELAQLARRADAPASLTLRTNEASSRGLTGPRAHGLDLLTPGTMPPPCSKYRRSFC